MLFIGLELASSQKKPSSLAIMEGDEFHLALKTVKKAKTDEEILLAIQEVIEDKPVFIAINAPIVSQRRKKRHADELVNLLFGQYGADEHLADRANAIWKEGKTRGGLLVEQLSSLFVKHDPYIKPCERTRKCFEVYPQAGMVVLFSLSRSLQYKEKTKGDDEERYEEFKRLQRYLQSLKNVHLPASLMKKDVTRLQRQGLQEYEHKMDALFSSYLAWYAWLYPKKCEVLGTMHEGYVLTPVFQREEKQLAQIFKKA